MWDLTEPQAEHIQLCEVLQWCRCISASSPDASRTPVGLGQRSIQYRPIPSSPAFAPCNNQRFSTKKKNAMLLIITTKQTVLERTNVNKCDTTSTSLPASINFTRVGKEAFHEVNGVWPHNPATVFRPPSATLVSAELFSHETGTLPRTITDCDWQVTTFAECHSPCRQ